MPAVLPALGLGLKTFEGGSRSRLESLYLGPKIQQTKMLVTCQRFGVLFLFGLVWRYSSVQTKYNIGRFKVMATLASGIDVGPMFINFGFFSRPFQQLILCSSC